MTFRLAMRNIKKSMSDYAVYFATLIIGISVFYVFNSITDQTVVITIYKNDMSIIRLLKELISMASVIVSFVLAFLIMYASNFLMKRRKKEFGIYMLLGMGKRKIASILMAETVLIGVISLIAGIVLGIVLSQGMSVLVAKLFEADMSKFKFEISTVAVGKTILYFLIMFALVLVLDMVIVGKSRLIRLLTAERRGERNSVKNPWVCAVVFAVSVIVLCHAYYMVTASQTDIDTQEQLLVQIVKGIVTTFLIFWSLSGLLIFFAKLRKKSYYRGINAFTTKEISSRINTNVLAGGIICLLLFITICVFSSCFSINQSVNDNIKKYAVADVNLKKTVKDQKDKAPISKSLTEKGVDMKMFDGAAEVLMYVDRESLEPGDKNVTYEGQLSKNVFTFGYVMRASDYEKVADIYGCESVHPGEDEYAVVCNYNYVLGDYEKKLASGHIVRLGGRELHPASKKCVDGFLEIAANPTNFGFMVVPDSVVTEGGQLIEESWMYIANYNASYNKGVEYIDKQVNSERFEKKLGKSCFVSTRTKTLQNSTSLTSMIIFLGLYLSIIFLIASAALLSLKELSQAADNREKYQILRKIGVEERMLNRSLLHQNMIFFGLPLTLAVVHSIFGIQVCVYIFESFGKTGLENSIVLTAAFLLVIYAIYFIITYRCSRKIISE